MPILVKDFTWTQTADFVNIRVPISSAKHEKVDLFTSSSYIKAHYSPFIFEVFLLHEVDITKSHCTIQDDLIVLELVKKDEIEWETLEKNITKAEKMQLKQEVLEKAQEEAKQASEDKRIKKSQLDRFTVQQAMDIDSKQHELMETRRDAERKKVMDDLEVWRVSNDDDKKSKSPVIESSAKTAENSTENKSEVQEPISKSEPLTNIPYEPVNVVELPPNAVVTKDKVKEMGAAGDTTEKANIKNKKSAVRKPTKTKVKSEYVEKKKEEVTKRVLPKMRQTGEVTITHTPRTFPTPSRESTAVEEATWLKNVTMARRATGFVSEDLRPEEQDPQWCKEKGDEFFKNGNFLGAISAYTHGITLSEKLPSLYANRSAAHFALGNFNKCLNDCSTAIELMKPACEGNRKSRAKCIARRAAALARVGYLNKAIDEMKAAAKLLPDDETIKKDIYDMERAWEQNPDSD